MKKLFCFLLIVCSGVFAAESDSVIRTLDNRDMVVTSVTALPDESLEYTMSDSKIKTRIPRGKYVYAWIPKPKEISAADGLLNTNQPEKAAAAYKAAYEKYKLLGWDIYCIYKESESLARIGEKLEAARKLDQLGNYKTINPRLLPQLAEVKRLNARLYIELEKYEQAIAILNEMTADQDDAAAAYGFLSKGDILLKQNKPKEAALMFLQTVLLFRGVPERAEALSKLYTTLLSIKDPNAQNFGEMLKREYPTSRFTKALFPEKK